MRLRLANQVRTLVGLTSQLVHDVDQEVTQERAQALGSTERARDQLTLVLSVTAAFTLLMAIVFGWYATRSITGPLATLDKGAKALGSGDFQHQIEVQGEDELARLGTAFNYAARQVRELYDELKSNEARFRALIEYSSDLILILDSEAIVRYVSPSSLRVVSRNQEELLGKSLFDFFAFADISKMRDTLGGAHTESRPAIEVGFRRPDGSMAVIEVLANNLLDEPAVAGVVVNARDMTESKASRSNSRICTNWRQIRLHEPRERMENWRHHWLTRSSSRSLQPRRMPKPACDGCSASHLTLERLGKLCRELSRT